MLHGADNFADFSARHSHTLQGMWHVELGNELRRSLRARQSARSRIAGIEWHMKPFGDRPNPFRRDSRHKSHRVRQRDARSNTMRYVPSRPDLMPEQVRNSKARVHRTENREPRCKLAIATMRQPFGAASLDRTRQMLHQKCDRFRTERVAQRVMAYRVNRLDSMIQRAHPCGDPQPFRRIQRQFRIVNHRARLKTWIRNTGLYERLLVGNSPGVGILARG